MSWMLYRYIIKLSRVQESSSVQKDLFSTLIIIGYARIKKKDGGIAFYMHIYTHTITYNKKAMAKRMGRGKNRKKNNR